MNSWTRDGNVRILIDIDEKGTGKRFNANSKWHIDNLANLYGNYHRDDGTRDTEKKNRKKKLQKRPSQKGRQERTKIKPNKGLVMTF